MDYELEIDGKKISLPAANLKPRFEIVEEHPPEVMKARKAKVARAPRRNPIVTAAVEMTPPLPEGPLVPTPFNNEMIQQLQAFQQNQNQNVFPNIVAGIAGIVGTALIGGITRR